ncbi:hypothetical protein M9H77_36398 [Catharanthus roseus]|uniref:Uncharacterized protein n=1 Tax=Catharanthus roseus TaxID=4058 RepID=A0ACB9ZTM4_CATRO|nr:hypothetical protein M9H77_36398 [Catharanthus roseus]
MNRTSQSPSGLNLGPMTKAQRRKLKKATQVEYNVFNCEGAIRGTTWDENLIMWKLEILNRGLIMSTDGHFPTQSHQEGTSEPSIRNLNETLKSMQQSIEELPRQFYSIARHVEELKKGKNSATMEKRVGDNLCEERRGSLGGKGYHISQEEFPRDEAWCDDNIYNDYGDNPSVCQGYHGGYYGNQEGDKALDKIKVEGA